MRELYSLRAEQPWQVPASEAYLLLRAGLVLPVEAHSELLSDYLRAARAVARPRRDNCRVVVTGLFCEQPPLNLIKSLELAGCYFIDDDLPLVTPWPTPDVIPSCHPLPALAHAFPAPSHPPAAQRDPAPPSKRPDRARPGKAGPGACGPGAVAASCGWCTRWTNCPPRWPVPGGGSPDMGNVSADGKYLWLAARYDDVAYRFDTASGDVVQVKVGAEPPGLTVWPHPGRHSPGQPGNTR